MGDFKVVVEYIVSADSNIHADIRMENEVTKPLEKTMEFCKIARVHAPNRIR